MSTKNRILQITLGGVFAALICITTMSLKIHVPITQGYVHLGDALILLCASLLGWLSIPAAAIGSMLADLIAGYPLYCLPTFIIKGLVAAVAVLMVNHKTPLWKAIIAFVAAELVMVAGYFLVEWLPLGYGLEAAAASVGPNLLQGLFGVVLASLFLHPFRMIYRRAFR